MKSQTKKEYKDRVKQEEKEERKRRGSEIYGARDLAVDRAHQRMVNSNGYGY